MSELTARRQPTALLKIVRQINSSVWTENYCCRRRCAKLADTWHIRIGFATQRLSFYARIKWYQAIYFYYRHLCWRLFYVYFCTFSSGRRENLAFYLQPVENAIEEFRAASGGCLWAGNLSPTAGASVCTKVNKNLQFSNWNGVNNWKRNRNGGIDWQTIGFSDGLNSTNILLHTVNPARMGFGMHRDAKIINIIKAIDVYAEMTTI